MGFPGALTEKQALALRLAQEELNQTLRLALLAQEMGEVGAFWVRVGNARLQTEVFLKLVEAQGGVPGPGANGAFDGKSPLDSLKEMLAWVGSDGLMSNLVLEQRWSEALAKLEWMASGLQDLLFLRAQDKKLGNWLAS